MSNENAGHRRVSLVQGGVQEPLATSSANARDLYLDLADNLAFVCLGQALQVRILEKA